MWHTCPSYSTLCHLTLDLKSNKLHDFEKSFFHPVQFCKVKSDTQKLQMHEALHAIILQAKSATDGEIQISHSSCIIDLLIFF